VVTPAAAQCSSSDDACTSFTCDPTTGTCKDTPKALNCDDNDGCTNDYCDPARGGCVHDQVVCPVFSACTPNVCQSSGPNSWQCTPGAELVCDDSKHCTVDRCDVVRGCVYTPIVCPDPADCHIITGCDETRYTANDNSSVCVYGNVPQLYDLCGTCRGNYISCFFKDTSDFEQAAGIAGGVVAAIVIAAVIALAAAIFASKKGYDHYQALTQARAAGANENPLFKNNQNQGNMPDRLYE